MIDEDSYEAGYSKGEDEGYRRGLEEGYENGSEETAKTMERDHSRELDNIKDDLTTEYETKIEDLCSTYDEKISTLTSYILSRQEEIQSLMTNIQELRRANAKLQQLTGTNPGIRD